MAVQYERQLPTAIAWVSRLGGFLPRSDDRDAMRTGLVRAGFRAQDAPLLLLGFKVLLAVALPVAWLGFSYFGARPLANVLPITIAGGLVGFYLPTAFISMRQSARHTEMLAALPDALDLMVVCVEAGLGIAAAMQRVAVEIRMSSRALSEELVLVHQEMQAGVSRTEALRGLARRTGIEEIYALVAMLIQTDRLGTSVAQALRAHADSMRIRRRQRAEQLARKASVKLAFPLVLLIFPALLVVILGPAAIQLAQALSWSEPVPRRKEVTTHVAQDRPVDRRDRAGRPVVGAPFRQPPPRAALTTRLPRGEPSMKHRRGRRNQRGAALVEFALALPLLFALLLAIVDFGLYFFIEHTVQFATREGVRLALVGGRLTDTAGNPMSREASIVQRVRDKATVAVDATRLEISIFPLNADYTEPANWSGMQNAGTPGGYMRVRARYSYTFITPMLAALVPGGHLYAQGEATYRNEFFQ